MAKKTKRKRQESLSSIGSVSMDSPSRPGTADPQNGQSGDMMRTHITALHKLCKKGGCNATVKELVEKLVALFSFQEKKAEEQKEDMATQLNLMKSRADEIEANLQAQIHEMRTLVDELKTRTVEIEKKPVSFEDGYRVRSLVLSGLQLPTQQHLPNSQVRVHSLKTQVEDIMAYLGVNYVVLDCFQMGRHLVKARFGTREAVQEVLKRAPKLRYSAFNSVHIRPSLTVEERATRGLNLRNAQHEKRDRESRGESVFIRQSPNFLEFTVEARRPVRRTVPSSNNKHPNLAGI